jgi:preprotein translocase subunit YajC
MLSNILVIIGQGLLVLVVVAAIFVVIMIRDDKRRARAYWKNRERE